MARHRQLQASAESGTMNRHHYGLAAVFDREEQRKKPGAARFARSDLSKFLDIGSGNKRLSAANKDRCFHGGIIVDLFDGTGNSLRHPGAEGIHRWIVDRNDGDVVAVVFAQSYQVAHVTPIVPRPLSQFRTKRL